MAIFDNKAKIIQGYQKMIDEKKISINKYYDEIGRLYYGQYKDMSVDSTKEINTRCEAVTRLTDEIELINLKILFEQGKKRCPKCKTANNLEYGFCFSCGEKFAEDSSNPPTEAAVKAPEAPAEAEEENTELPGPVDEGAAE